MNRKLLLWLKWNYGLVRWLPGGRRLWRWAVRRIDALYVAKLDDVYACCDWRSWATYWNAAKGTGIVPKNMIVWEKNGSGVGTNYANTHELLFFGILAGVQVQMRDALKGSFREVLKPNVWHMGRVASAGHKDGRLHNAQKSVALVRQALENSTDKRGVVLDLFAGAGTTAIAAEECGRVARLIELEPKWCDVIRRRYADLVGDKKLAP